jgi:hypothetical protein
MIDSVAEMCFFRLVSMLAKFAIGALIATMVSGCAKAPESIAPAYVSQLTYQDLRCPQLASEEQRLSQALATASKQQNNARTQDTVGVLLLGLPVASMSGDNIAPEIARLKGEQEAIRQQQLSKGCA